tara:strand:- start:3073 stop:3594 length:522 start_codon:yes stop_codon:yes gene_type:complete
MKFYYLLILLAFMYSCTNKPKSVFICGDHVCINKAEAKQYFEDNLSIEVKIIDKKQNKNIDLVQLNLKNSSLNKEISIEKKSETNKKIRSLSNEEISNIKLNLKNKKNIKKDKVVKKQIKQKKLTNKRTKKTINKKILDDVCKTIDKCTIEEISKYLIKQGKNKKFPDITIRQ